MKTTSLDLSEMWVGDGEGGAVPMRTMRSMSYHKGRLKNGK